MVIPEVMQPKSEPRGPGTPSQAHRGCNVHGPGWGRISHPIILHTERGTPQTSPSPPGPQKPAQNPAHPRRREPPCTTAVVLWGGSRWHPKAWLPPLPGGCKVTLIRPSSRDRCPAGLGQPLGPGGVGEGDVVEAGPAGKDLFLGDEAVVVAPAAALVVDVGRALVGALGLVVVVGQAPGRGVAAAGQKEASGEPRGGVRVLRWGPGGVSSPAVAGGHHAIDVDGVTQLHRDHHGEPACAEPRTGLLPGEQKQQE